MNQRWKVHRSIEIGSLIQHVGKQVYALWGVVVDKKQKGGYPEHYIQSTV